MDFWSFWDLFEIFRIFGIFWGFWGFFFGFLVFPLDFWDFEDFQDFFYFLKRCTGFFRVIFSSKNTSSTTATPSARHFLSYSWLMSSHKILSMVGSSDSIEFEAIGITCILLYLLLRNLLYASVIVIINVPLRRTAVSLCTQGKTWNFCYIRAKTAPRHKKVSQTASRTHDIFSETANRTK